MPLLNKCHGFEWFDDDTCLLCDHSKTIARYMNTFIEEARWDARKGDPVDWQALYNNLRTNLMKGNI